MSRNLEMTVGIKRTSLAGAKMPLGEVARVEEWRLNGCLF